MRPMTDDDRKQVVVGRPMPFSAYSQDRTLLLAAGRAVPNEFVREGLLRSGKFCSVENDAAAQTAQVPVGSGPIAALLADYQHTHARAPVGFRMERDGQTGTARIIGVTDDGHGLIMSWPNGEPAIALQEGDEWTFRAFYATAAVRFHGTIGEVTRGAFAYFSVARLSNIERRSVREWARAPTCVWAAHGGEPARVIVDLSVGGARIAVDDKSHLQAGQGVMLTAWLPLAIGRKELIADATVLNAYGRADERHPAIEFFGVRFENLSEPSRLLLHAFVQEQLAIELDRVWYVLSLTH